MTTAVLMKAAESPAFTASAIPTVILDADLTICAVNRAYEQVCGRSRETLVGTEVFVAFPDNPADPAGAGSVRLLASLDYVLSSRERHHMGFLRYDLPDPYNPDIYLPRVWSPVNSPIMDHRRPVGVIQQVEEVTQVLYGATTPVLTDNERVSQLAVALSNATATVAAVVEENRHLREALASNRVIGVAIGVLMGQHHISRHQAFDLLRFHSQYSNRKLPDLAEHIADTGALPSVK